MLAPTRSPIPAPAVPRAAVERAAWRLLALLIAVYVLHMVDRMLVAILLEPLRVEFRLSDTQLGFLSGLAYSGAAIAAGVPLGMLADRVSRKRLLLGALACWSVLTGLCGLAVSYPMLLLARMGVGAAESGAPPACLSMIGDAFPEHARARATSLFYASGGLGVIITFTVGAWIAASFGWRTAFLAAAVPGVVMALVLTVLLREPDRRAPEENAAYPDRRADSVRGAMKREPALPMLILALALATVGPACIGTWTPSLLIRNHGFSIPMAGLVVAITAGVILPVGQITGGFLGDRLLARGRGYPMLLCAFGSAVGALVAAIGLSSSSLPVLLTGVLASAFVQLLCIGPTFSALITLAPPGRRATIMALTTVSANVAAYGGGPVLVGMISDALGGTHSLGTALPLAMIVPMLAGFLYLVLFTRLQKSAQTPT